MLPGCATVLGWSPVGGQVGAPPGWALPRPRRRLSVASAAGACVALAARMPVRPGRVSAVRSVPPSIPRPDYVEQEVELDRRTGLPRHPFMYCTEVKTPEQVLKMRKACALAREALEVARDNIKATVTTDDVDAAVHDFVVSKNAYPSPLGYLGFKKSVSTSVNDVIAHGIPDDRALEDGDILNVDVKAGGVCALSSLARPMVTSRLRKATDCDENESRERLERALLAEIEAGLSGNHSAFDFDRLHTLEEELRPLYSTLPHEMPLADIKGGLGFTAARYLLHQYFVRRHSWYVRGLNPAGDGRKPPDHKEALRSRVAGHLLELIEQKVGLQGLNLKTLAVVVATLEHLLHGDERQRLKQSWLVHDLKPEDLTDAQGLQSVVEVFMAHFVYSSQKSDSGYVLTLQKGREEVSFISRIYDGWTQISQAIRREVQKIQGKDFNFNDAVQVTDQVLENFRTVSGSMCRDMSAMLAQMPGGPVGRVPLHEMRKKDLFRETLEYLRAANALDESEPEPIVLVPNYMLGPSNCDGTTSFYGLCCPDLCAGHRSAFEGAISDAQSMEFLQDLALEEGAAAASLPKLRELLDAEADLHGPEFSMWLHKTFPQHCPRPDLPALSSASASARAEFQATAQVGSLFEW